MKILSWLRSKYQKVRRGYSDDELWNLDATIAEWIVPRLKTFKEKNCGYPIDVSSKEEWDGELYIKVEYYDDELCINNTIFCKEVNSYRPISIPIFKVGMRVRNKQTGYVNTIKQITTNHYMFNLGEYVFDIEDGFSIMKQNEWEEI